MLAVCAIGNVCAQQQAETIDKRKSSTEFFKKYMKNDRGIEFVQKDSLFSTQFQFRMQNRAAYQSTSESDFTPETFEFRTRRLRMKLKGFAYSPKLTYYVQLSFSRGDMDWDGTQNASINSSPNVVRDATISYQFTKALKVSIGQTKLPGNRQRVVSSGDLQFADRSIVNATFTLDRDFGFHASFDKPYYSLKGAITSGEGRNTNRSDKGLSYTGRIELLPFGRFANNNDYIEGDLAREPKPKLSLAGTYNFNSRAERQAGQLGNDLYEFADLQNLSVDMVFKFKGFAFYNEFCTRKSNKPITVSSADPTKTRSSYVGYGNLTQASYLFKNNYEIAVRYAFIAPFSSIYNNPIFLNVNEKAQQHIHLGVTKYVYGHRVKLQGNLTYQSVQDLRNDKQLNQLGAIFQVELGI